MGPVTRRHYPKYTLVEQSSIEAWQGVAEAKYEMPPSSDRRYLRHGTTGTTGTRAWCPHGLLMVPSPCPLGQSHNYSLNKTTSSTEQ